MIGENVLEGKPFEGEFIFDIHAHLHDTSDFQMRHTSPEEVASTLEKTGIAGACVSSILSLHGDCRLGNEMVRDAVRRFPGRIYGYLAVSPHYEDDPSLFFEEPGFLGLKVHAAFHRSSIDDPLYYPYLTFANERELPVLFHTWEVADILHVAGLAKRFPRARMIIGHGAMRTWEVKREVIDAVRKYDNIFADTTVSVAYDGAVEYAADKLGTDRLCYGSDIPFYDCRHVVGKVATSKLSDADKRKILGENARRILGLPN